MRLNQKGIYFLSIFIFLQMMITQPISADNSKLLIEASEKGDVVQVKELIAKGVDVNSKDENGGTALFYASEKNFIDIVKELLKAGTDVNIIDNYNYTALYLAASKGNSLIVKELIQAGANLNGSESTALGIHTMPLLPAMLLGEKGDEIVKSLIEAGTDLNLKIAISKGATPLWFGVHTGRLDIVKMMLDAGADVNAQDNNGNTILHAAVLIAFKGDRTTFSEIIRELIKAGVNINAKDNLGWTALIIASSMGAPILVQDLINAGADVNVQDNDGNSALSIATKTDSYYLAPKENYSKIIKLLEPISK